MNSSTSSSLVSSSPILNSSFSSVPVSSASISSTYTESAIRSLSLAHAAIKHALYFLELDAQARAASYCDYAAERLREYSYSINAPCCET